MPADSAPKKAEYDFIRIQRLRRLSNGQSKTKTAYFIMLARRLEQRLLTQNP
jgi:hypothetical protein